MKRNLLWIEAARTLAMLIVIGWHSIQGLITKAGHPGWITIPATMLTFAVPMFFMISGFLAQRSSSTVSTGWSAYLSHKVTGILIPFLVWNVIYMLFYKMLFGWPILTGNTLWLLLTGYIQLWFVFVLFQFFILHKLFIQRLDDAGSTKALIWAGIASFAFYALSTNLLMLQGNDNHFFEWHWGKLFVGWSLFYFCGVYLGQHSERLRKISEHMLPLGLMTLLSFLLYLHAIHSELATYGSMVRQYLLLTGLPFQLLASLFVLVVLIRMEKRNNCIVRWLAPSGRDTFGIYLMHLVPLFGLLSLFRVMGWQPGVLQSMFAAVLTWIICLASVRICRMEKFRVAGKWLFGGR